MLRPLGTTVLGRFGLMAADGSTDVFGPSLIGAVEVGGAVVFLGSAATEGLPPGGAGVASTAGDGCPPLGVTPVAES